MAPMMSKPLPEPLLKLKNKGKKAPPPKKKVDPVHALKIVTGAVLLGGTGGMLLYAVLNTHGVDVEKKVKKLGKEESVEGKLEHGTNWFANEKAAKLARAKMLLDEADKDGKIAGRMKQRTALMAINLRTLIEDPRKIAEEEKARAAKKDGTTREDWIETGASKLRKPVNARPVKTDRRGRPLPERSEDAEGKGVIEDIGE